VIPLDTPVSPRQTCQPDLPVADRETRFPLAVADHRFAEHFFFRRNIIRIVRLPHPGVKHKEVCLPLRFADTQVERRDPPADVSSAGSVGLGGQRPRRPEGAARSTGEHFQRQSRGLTRSVRDHDLGRAVAVEITTGKWEAYMSRKWIK